MSLFRPLLALISFPGQYCGAVMMYEEAEADPKRNEEERRR